MKKVLLSLHIFVSAVSAFSQVSFSSINFSPSFPKPGDTLSFEFDASKSTLSSYSEVSLAIYFWKGSDLKATEPILTKKGSIYSGTFAIDSGVDCIIFQPSSGEKKEDNSGKGFMIPVYNSESKPLMGYYLSAAKVYGGNGPYLFGIPDDFEKSLALLDEGLAAYPNAKTDASFMSEYLYLLGSTRKPETNNVILKYLANLEAKDTLSESDFSELSRWYSKLNYSAKSDSFTALRKLKYPNGKSAFSDARNIVYAEKDIDRKKQLLKELIAAYPQYEDENFRENIRAQIARGYAANKNIPAFMEVASKLSPARKYSIYNDLAWEMVEAKEDLVFARQFSKEATGWAKKEVSNPTEKMPDYYTQYRWQKNREAEYAMYADTYGLILFNEGEFKQGLPYAKDAAAINKFQDAGYNERYIQLLEKVSTASEVKPIVVQMIADGKATAKIKQVLKNIYVQEKKSATGFDAYLAKVEVPAKKKQEEEIIKTKLNEPAPKFILKDVEGKDVSLESLKGKVVVVDFWATWCGPCIASMPGMKLAEKKLKVRGDVVFLFVDTRESGENKKQNAVDFMKKKNFPFHVLMDDDNKVVSDFGVSGIPTKFIIDKTGNIRFKTVGFNGNADELVDELSVMVDLASK